MRRPKRAPPPHGSAPSSVAPFINAPSSGLSSPLRIQRPWPGARPEAAHGGVAQAAAPGNPPLPFSQGHAPQRGAWPNTITIPTQEHLHRAHLCNSCARSPTKTAHLPSEKPTLHIHHHRHQDSNFKNQHRHGFNPSERRKAAVQFLPNKRKGHHGLGRADVRPAPAQGVARDLRHSEQLNQPGI